MKITVLGDIHGGDIWKPIVQKEEDSDLIIFLGDYVASSPYEEVTGKDQVSNLMDILEYKDENPDKVILLRGNHDLQHLGYYWAECSRLNSYVLVVMSDSKVKDTFLHVTKWIHIHDNIIFSHAGVSQVWLDEVLKDKLENVNNHEPSEEFGFWPDDPFDLIGVSKTQPCTWIRPSKLIDCMPEGYIQVVGHTTQYGGLTHVNDLWLCDSLGERQYLVIEDNEFKIRKI